MRGDLYKEGLKIMLAALCVGESRRRWMSFRRRPPVVKSELVTAGSGRYLKITADKGRNGQIDWVGVRKAAGRETSRLLIPRGIIPPSGSRIAAFRGVELARQLMTSAAVELLKIVAINPRLVKIAIYDPRGVMPELPIQFIPYASDVRVITNRFDRYKAQQFMAMQQFGAVLSVTDDPAETGGSLLLIAPEGFSKGDNILMPRGWIMTADSPVEHKKGVIYRYLPKVSHGLLSSTPLGCDAVQFLSGLYELSGIREIAVRPPEFLQTSGHTITLKDAAWRLAGLDIGISV
ncbi:MAG: hypothetical protein PHR24_05180 [Oscillospiraceae bacterium]|nr:hypothetical protein [Oscillospiraceae bacterium]MDD3833294.1 hypothetical protein [Oscillospiraceae bacterium]MDD4546669.1 hypothetical protein [Oscillospiraceae bacterium]